MTGNRRLAAFHGPRALDEQERNERGRRDDRGGGERGRHRRDRAVDSTGAAVDHLRLTARPDQRERAQEHRDDDRDAKTLRKGTLHEDRKRKLARRHGGPVAELDRRDPADEKGERLVLRKRTWRVRGKRRVRAARYR